MEETLTDTEDGSIIEDNPFWTPTIVIHDLECWRIHGLCAIQKLEDIERLLSVAKSTINTSVIIKMIKG